MTAALPDDERPEPAPFRRAVTGPDGPVTLRSVSVQVGSLTILSGVSALLHPGELCALLGPSGAGKSTLIKVLLGIRQPSSGSVRIGSKNLADAGPIGYVPQDDAVHRTLTVEDALTYAAELRLFDAPAGHKQRRVLEVLTQVGLSDRRTTRIARLSGGQRKRVSLALELLTSPGLLVLDEPTSGLDPGLEAQMMTLFRDLARGGRVVLVATHAMESLERCDAILLLVAGHVAFFGAPRDALAFFGVDRYASIFGVLGQKKGPAWADSFRGSRFASAFMNRPPPAGPGGAPR